MANFDKYKIGEIRPNQLITTFGPGAIVDAVKDSVTVLDTNYWTEKGKKIIDGRLASYLGVSYFYMPQTSKKGDLPVVSFPYYHVCSDPKCGRLFDIRDNFDLPTNNDAFYGKVDCLLEQLDALMENYKNTK